MGAQFGAGISSEFRKTTGLLDYNLPYTVLMWVYYLSTPGSDQTAHSLNDGSLSSFDLFGRVTGGTTRLTVRTNGGGATTTTGSALALNTWYSTAMRRNNTTSLDFLLNGSVDQTNTANIAGRTAVAEQNVGEQVGGFADLDAYVGAMKEFNVALTDAEIAAETNTFLAKIADSRLHELTPVLPGSRTSSLRGSGWTEIGTVVDAPNPPITWGGYNVVPILPTVVVGGGTITSSLDAFLQKQISITASADSHIQKTIQLTAQADSILQKAFTLVSNADSLIQKNINATAQADGLLQKAISLISNADAILTVLGSGIITTSTDAHLQKLISLVANADAILVKIGILQANADAILQKTVTRTAQTDAILQKTLSNQSNADALLIRIASITASADAILTGLTNIFASADALLQKVGLTLSSSADALLQLPGKSIRVRRFNGLKHIDINGHLR